MIIPKLSEEKEVYNLLHKLELKAVNTQDYKNEEWKQLENYINKLIEEVKQQRHHY